MLLDKEVTDGMTHEEKTNYIGRIVAALCESMEFGEYFLYLWGADQFSAVNWPGYTDDCPDPVQHQIETYRAIVEQLSERIAELESGAEDAVTLINRGDD